MSNIFPVSVERHATKRWQRCVSYAFTAQDALCPLTLQELPRAVMSMPVALTTVEGGFAPAAVLGLQPGRNLFVTADGRWLAAYVPAAYRGHPFRLGVTPDGKQVLCVDEAAAQLDASAGEAFFENGQLSAAVAGVLEFLGQVAAGRQVTRRACAMLQEYGLIQPWPIKLQAGADAAASRSVEGLFRIDEAAFNALPGEALQRLRDVGALQLAYCQLLSMQHLAGLERLAQAHAQAAQQAAERARAKPAELDLEFLNRGETLSFSGL